MIPHAGKKARKREKKIDGRAAEGAARLCHDEGYAREELAAELGSAFLCADLGITPEIRPGW
jgi:antirestriction protein ArdC